MNKLKINNNFKTCVLKLCTSRTDKGIKFTFKTEQI